MPIVLLKKILIVILMILMIITVIVTLRIIMMYKVVLTVWLFSCLQKQKPRHDLKAQNRARSLGNHSARKADCVVDTGIFAGPKNRMPDRS